MSGVHFHSFNTRCKELISQMREYTSVSRLHYEYKQLLLQQAKEHDLKPDVVSVQEIVGELYLSESAQKDMLLLLQSSLWYLHALQHGLIGENDENMAILHNTNRLLDDTVELACAIPSRTLQLARGATNDIDLNLSAIDSTLNLSHVSATELPNSADLIFEPCHLLQSIPLYSTATIQGTNMTSLHPVYKRLVLEDLPLQNLLIDDLQAFVQLQLENNKLGIPGVLIHTYSVLIGMLEYKLLFKKSIKVEDNDSPLIKHESVLFMGLSDNSEINLSEAYLPQFSYYLNLGSLLLSVNNSSIEQLTIDQCIHSCNMHSLVVLCDNLVQSEFSSLLSLILLVAILPGTSLASSSHVNTRSFVRALSTQIQVLNCLSYLPTPNYAFQEAIESKIGRKLELKLASVNAVLLASNLVKTNYTAFKEFTLSAEQFKTRVDKHIDSLWTKRGRFLLRLFHDRTKRINREIRQIESTILSIVPQMHTLYEDERNSSVIQLQENSDVISILHNTSLIQGQKLTAVENRLEMELEKNSGLQQQLEEALNRIAELVGEVEKNKEVHSEMQGKYADVCTRNVELKGEVADLMPLKQRMKETSEQLEEELLKKMQLNALNTKLQGENEELSRSYEAVRIELAQSKEAYLHIRQHNTNFEKQLQVKEKDILLLKDSLAESEKKCKAVSDSMELVQQEITLKNQEYVKSIRIQAVDHQVILSRNSSLEIEVSKQQEKNASLLAMQSASEGRVTAQETAFTTANEEHASAMQTLSKKCQATVNKTKAVMEEQKREQELRSREKIAADQLQQTFDKELITLKQHIRGLKQQNKQLQEAVDVSKAEAVSSIQKRDEAIQTASRQAKSVSVLKTELADKTSALQQLTQTVEQYQNIASMLSGVK